MASNCASSGSSTSIPETSSKSKEDFLNEILTCGICLSRLSSACCLPCAHSFCRSCLLDYAQNSRILIQAPINSIKCPYCNFQINFRSLEHFESMLIINPILKQLCEALDETKSNSDPSSSSQTNNTYRARCHTCCLLKMLKVCKHCYFMLCETCRRTHLLDVHRECRMQLDILNSNLHSIDEKRQQMDRIAKQYDHMKDQIQNYVQNLIRQIEYQRDNAFQVINQQLHLNDEAFWTGNGFDNEEKFEFFHTLAEISQKKLSAKNITDKDLMELSDNLQTIPDIDEKRIESIKFSQLSLKLDETSCTNNFIHIYDDNNSSTTSTTNHFENNLSNNEEADYVRT